MFHKVLIANRGAIACRIIRSLKKMGILSVAVYSEADRHARHVVEADEAVLIGPAVASESYLNQANILAAARATGAEAIHPGYGFLSENAAFAAACAAAGIAFIGPTPQQMRDFGLKHTARALAEQNSVPLLPGSGLLSDVSHALQEAERIGYPVMLKSTAGGGGIGMKLCWEADQLNEAYDSVDRLSRSNFSQGGLFLEKYVEVARHIEVQIFGDGQGQVVALGERDCSVQRRNQKVIEETPAPGLAEPLRAALFEAAVRLGKAVNYRSAGTVEFVYDVNNAAFYFLEVNTRLQVEHGVTERVTGVDLVEWMVQVAANEPPALGAFVYAPQGHSVQVRLYAEDPGKQFQPSAGLLNAVQFPEHLSPTGIRIDSWIETGTEVSAYYDPMLAKVIAHGATRTAALAQLVEALANTQIYGIETNLDYLQQVINDSVFVSGQQTTRYLDHFTFKPRTIDVLSPGTQSMIQDFPGRVGYWDIGVPPSGPMDDLAFRVANRIVGNLAQAAGLEMTITGPNLRFNTATVIALTGAHMKAELDGKPIDFGQPIEVSAGSVLKLKSIQGGGSRTYMALQGGLDAADYMGSKATFTLGQFGGHAGRCLRAGDVLRLNQPGINRDKCAAAPTELVPEYTQHWDIAVMYGPHAAPDFFTDDDIATFFATDWQVHYNSSRTGVRLIGPKPTWARTDGGEAGLHPSNIHDNAYAIGAVDFTGDMPVILGPDGPSLGGFVCPVTLIQAELWKMGQLTPGDTIRFYCVDYPQAQTLASAQVQAIEQLTAPTPLAVIPQTAGATVSPILYQTLGNETRVAVCYRQAGDRSVLIEYGPIVLDLDLRFRVHALMTWMKNAHVPGILDLTPGIRSLQVHFDSRVLPQPELVRVLQQAEANLPAIDDMTVPSRIVYLPLSWDDPATQLAIDKYMQSVRPDAPWCPSNIEFIRRINGLESIEAVKEILFNAHYLVMGLGDVYLGAPVATPLDPRHRLVTTKYNPARTWTPENAVGIGGAYLCIYGMEGPGGYQFVGRTVQMWNRYRQTRDFTEGKQWLLRFFDQLRFYPVSADELMQLRDDFIQGKFKLRVEETELKLRDYRMFLTAERDSIDTFKSKQQAAFDAERDRWALAGQAGGTSDFADTDTTADNPAAIPAGCIALTSPVTGNIWQLRVQPGDTIEIDQEMLIVEAMKMEISIQSEETGTITEILCAQGTSVVAGQTLLIIKPHQDPK
ncbi:MAG: urea carboxylase [Halothiobacillus sp.]